MATQLIADSRGVVRGKFSVPAGVPSGTKLVSAVGAGGTAGTSFFSGQGTLERQTFQQQTTISETRWQSPPPPVVVVPWRMDPLAETFTLQRNTQLSGVDLFFTKASTTLTRVQIRGTTVGFPNREILAEAVIQPHQIAVPPLVDSGAETIGLTGVGSAVIPSGILSVSVSGRGTAGVAAVAGVAPTFGSYTYAGVFPTNALVGSITLPFTTVAPSSFSITAGWADGSSSITFTKVSGTETQNFAEYRGVHPVSGGLIAIHASRPTLTSGTTAVAAEAGLSATFTLNGNSYTFPGAALGVSTAPAVTTQTIALPGTSALTMAYSIPEAGSMSLTHNAVSGAPGSATRVTFPSPVLLLAGAEYALVVLCDDAIGSLAVAELGKFDAHRQEWVTSQPYTIGALLSSSNASTWTAHQDRDMAFRLLSASYTAQARTIPLGLATVTGATDLILMSFAERPASATNVSYLLTLPDSTVVTVSDGQPVQLPSPITGDVQVSAVLSGTDSMAPVLFPGTQLAEGKVALSANYISRAVPAGASVTIKVIYEAVIPSGAAVAVSYKGIDAGDTWTSVSIASTRSVDDGFVEFVHTITGITETAIQAQLLLTGASAARPRVRDLRIIVL